MVAILFRTLDALRMYDLPVIMISSSSNSPTATISQLVVEDLRQGHFNSASALSTLIFLLIFAVAFIMIRFLGADVAPRKQKTPPPLPSAPAAPVEPIRIDGSTITTKENLR